MKRPWRKSIISSQFGMRRISPMGIFRKVLEARIRIRILIFEGSIVYGSGPSRDIILDDDMILVRNGVKKGQCRNPCRLTLIVSKTCVSTLKYQDCIDAGNWVLASELKSRFRCNRLACLPWFV